MNFHETLLGNISRSYESLDQLVTIPLPLPYLQHCKFLLFLFMVFYPLCVDIHHGLFSNVVVPSLIAMALLGFEMVADNFENPFGDDDSDLNFLETIHSLEVEIQSIFNLSERDATDVFQSWRELGQTFELCDYVGDVDDTEGNAQTIKSYSFTDFFEWAPLPVHTLEYLIRTSGTVQTVHATQFNPLKKRGAVKRMIDSLKSRTSYSLLLEQENEARKELEVIAHDVFVIKNYVRLIDKGSRRHRRAVDRQISALDGVDRIDGRGHSIKNLVHRASQTFSQSLDHVDVSNL